MWTKTGSVFWTILLIAPAVMAGDNALRLSATVDRETVYLMEQFYYQLTIEGASRSFPEPRFAGFEGFKIVGGPSTSSQFQFINGKVSNSVVYTYVLQAQKEGKWTLPPVSINLEGKSYQSNSVTVEVITTNAPAAQTQQQESGNEAGNIPKDRVSELFLWASVDQEEPFVGQPIRVSYEVYTLVPISELGVKQSPSYTGFWTEDVVLPKNPTLYKKQIYGKEYSVAKVNEVVLYPTVTGELVIDPLTMGFAVQVRGRDPFDDFFGGSPFGSRLGPSMMRQQEEVRSSQALKINIKPLPGEGRPADFSGAVGNFEMTAKVDKPSVQVGEGIVVKVKLSGNQGLKTLPAPKFADLPGFKSFEPKTGEISFVPGREGWKMRDFDYILVPHQEGDFTIPAISYNFFDPESKAYKATQTAAIPIHVNPGLPGSEQPALVSSGGEIKLLGTAIRYIKTNVRITSYVPPYRTVWFLIILILPLPVVPATIIYGRHRRRMQGDEAYARSFIAKTESVKRFASARKAFENQDLNGAVDETAAAFAGYLGNRLNLPVAGMTLRLIEEQLSKRHMPEDQIGKIADLWKKLETARFSPLKPAAESIQGMIGEGESIINRLEAMKLKKIKQKLLKESR
jgi:hypothetical protein